MAMADGDSRRRFAREIREGEGETEDRPSQVDIAARSRSSVSPSPSPIFLVIASKIGAAAAARRRAWRRASLPHLDIAIEVPVDRLAVHLERASGPTTR